MNKNPSFFSRMFRNENGDISYDICSPNLEFFTKFVGGKEYGPKGSQTLEENDEKVFDILDRMWYENPELTVKNIFYKGDCRGGAKEKKLFRVGMNWLIQKHPQWSNLSHVPEYRYWKDLITISAQNPSVRQEVVELFAKQLLSDHKMLVENLPGISLCAKWVPTEGCAEDKRDPHFLNNLRNLLGMNHRKFRKELIVPLRTHLKIVESFMCAKEWENIDYSQVPSVAMQNYKKTFQKHDPVRFAEWAEKLKRGNAKINVSQLFPHTIAKPYFYGGQKDDIIEAQFKALTENVKKMGIFDRSLVISDTSASMSGTPMDVSITLGILISRCLSPPFTNLIINFDEQPTFSKLTGNDLHQDIQIMRQVPWAGSTNLDLVFDQVLQKAKEMELPPEKFPNRLYILTDMQFNQLEGEVTTKGALQRANEKFASYGYEVPEIVCWNLRGNTTTSAMPDNQKGMCTITGFSTSILSAVMNGRKIPDPYSTMVETLTGERYKRLNFPGK